MSGSSKPKAFSECSLNSCSSVNSASHQEWGLFEQGTAPP